MARIRTIKPEFFTSEDIVGLSPLARLLYIALWCEADKEGRMVWKPRTFKIRYLPADACDIEALCAELLNAELIVLYGEGYAHIPAFCAHQHINPRETKSQLPEPHASTTRQPRVGTRQPRDSDAQGGREGKGKERKDATSAFEPPDFIPADAWQAFEEMRQKIRKPMTDRARQLVAAEVRRLRDEGQDPRAVIEQSVRNSWQDVYALKPNAKGGASNPFAGAI